MRKAETAPKSQNAVKARQERVGLKNRNMVEHKLNTGGPAAISGSPVCGATRYESRAAPPSDRSRLLQRGYEMKRDVCVLIWNEVAHAVILRTRVEQRMGAVSSQVAQLLVIAARLEPH